MKNVDLINGPIDSTLRRFTFPLTISFIVHILYSWVDMYFVSKLGHEAIAAVGVSEQILFFAFGIGMGFGVGTGVIVSRRVGEKNFEEAGKTAVQGLFFMLFFSIIIAGTLFFSLDSILDIMKLENEVQVFATDYLILTTLGLPFSYLTFQINSMMRSAGNTFIPMILLISSNVLNAILTPFFIFGIGPFPEWGVFGAAFATLIAQVLGCLFALFVLLKYFDKIPIRLKHFRPDLALIFKIIKLGVPASAQILIISFNRIALSWFANYYGTVILTTYMLGLKVDMFVFMSIFAVGAAIEVITGQNLGAKKIDRIFDYFKSAVKQISGLMILLGVIIFFFGKHFAILFSDNPEIIDNVAYYLKINSFSYLFFAVGIFSIRVISGAGDYLRSLILVTIVLYGIQIPLIYLLSLYFEFGYEGIWFGILASQICFSLIGYLSLMQKKWIKMNL
jgi:putative MATE family efflux protein